MKNYLILLLFGIQSSTSFSQNQFKIFIGGGFENDTITLIGSYYVRDKFMSDTIIFGENIQSNHVSGLGRSLKAKFSKNSRYDLTIEINDKTFLYQTDKLCRKSELRIENYHEIDFCLLFRGGFKFY